MSNKLQLCNAFSQKSETDYIDDEVGKWIFNRKLSIVDISWEIISKFALSNNTKQKKVECTLKMVLKTNTQKIFDI